MIPALVRRLPGRRDERGNAIMEFTALGILLLVPIMYIMLSVFEVQSALYGVSAAAREASRTYTLSDDNAHGQQRAREAARAALQSQNIAIGDVTFPGITCENGGCMTAGSVAVANISYRVPLPLWPDLFGTRPTVNVTSEHRTPFGQYRMDQ